MNCPHFHIIYITQSGKLNVDLRHYIPILVRRSRCFARKLEMLHAVFVDAYNKFGKTKRMYRLVQKRANCLSLGLLLVNVLVHSLTTTNLDKSSIFSI